MRVLNPRPGDFFLALSPLDQHAKGQSAQAEIKRYMASMAMQYDLRYRRLSRPQWLMGESSPIPRLVPPITFRKRLRGALPRSRARGRRAQTRQHTPQAPAEQPRSHAQAPAEDDPQRSHTGSGAHAPAASCPRARRAGQPSIASRKKALSGRVTPLLSKSGCIFSPQEFA